MSAPTAFVHRPTPTSTLGMAMSWREVQPGLWVARVSGDIVGSVEFVRSYIATDARGDVVGSFTTLEEAQAAIDKPSTGMLARIATRRSRVSRRLVAEWALVLALPVTGIALFGVVAAIWIAS